MKKEIEWVPCEERPPEETASYLVTIIQDDKTCRTGVDWYNIELNEWMCMGPGLFEGRNVIAWAYYPEPYQPPLQNR